jgi:hypothetical protein
LSEQLNRINKNDYTAPVKLTVAEFQRARWLPTLDVRASTRDSYERSIARHVIPRLGGIKLQALTADRLTWFYRELSASGHRYGKRGPKSVRNLHGTIHKALKDARKWGRAAHGGSRPLSAFGVGMVSGAWFTRTTRSRHDVRVPDPYRCQPAEVVLVLSVLKEGLPGAG